MVRAAFERLLGLPSWGVENTHGSFLALNFGAPSLVVGDVRSLLGAKPRRAVHVEGAYYCWIEQAFWTLSRDAARMTSADSPRPELQVALRDHLDGQALSAVGLQDRVLTLTFDLGSELTVEPWPGEALREDSCLWHMCDATHWLSLNADGRVTTERHAG